MSEGRSMMSDVILDQQNVKEMLWRNRILSQNTSDFQLDRKIGGTIGNLSRMRETPISTMNHTD